MNNKSADELDEKLDDILETLRYGTDVYSVQQRKSRKAIKSLIQTEVQKANDDGYKRGYESGHATGYTTAKAENIPRLTKSKQENSDA